MKAHGTDSWNSWCIAFASCFIYTVFGGIFRIKGMLFAESITRFNVTREKASFPFALSGSCRAVLGPLIGYLGQKYGVRAVTCFGAVLASVGAGLCYFAENITMITVLFGVAFGAGFGLCSLLLPVSINEHFQKHRATASGVCFSGNGLGSLIFPPLTVMLLSSYGFSGAFLIFGAIGLHGIPAALLLRKPRFEMISSESNRSKRSESGRGNSEKKVEPSAVDNDSFRSFAVQNLGQDITLGIESNCNGTHNLLVDQKEIKTQLSSQNVLFDHPVHMNRSDYLCVEPTADRAGNKQDPFGRSKSCEVSDEKLEDNILSETTVVKVKRVPSWKLFSVLYDPMFILVTISKALYVLTLETVLLAVIDFSRDIHIAESFEKYLIMVMSIGDFAGRLCIGWITDRGYMSVLTFVASCFILEGIATVAFAWSGGFSALITFMTLYSVSKAGLPVIIPVVIADYIDYDKQMIAMPSHEILVAPLVLTISPLIGYFRDTLGSYIFLFYGVGFLSIACGMTWIFVPYVAKCKKKY